MALNPILIRSKLSANRKIVIFFFLFSIASWGWVDYGWGGNHEEFEDSPAIQMTDKPILNPTQKGYNHHEHTLPTNRLEYKNNHQG